MTGRRLWFVGIGGAGLSAYAQLARAQGAEVGGWDRVRTPYLDAARRRAGRDRARAGRAGGMGGRRLVGVPAGSGAAAGGVPARARLRPRGDRRRGDARQGHDGRDDRLRPARDRPRPGMADRSARATARVERRLRRRHPRRRRRRVGPHGLRAARVDRRRHERRARPPHRVWSLGDLERAFEALARDGGRGRSRCAAVRRRAGAARRAEPPERRRRRSRHSRSPASRATRPRPRSRASPAPAGASRCTSSATGRSSTTTATTRPRSRARSRPCASATPAATVRVLFQPHLYSRTRHLAGELAAALSAADDVTVTDIYPRARAADPRRHRQARRRCAERPRCTRRRGRRRSTTGVERLVAAVRPGDVLLVVGAGDIDRAVGMLRSR